MPSAGPTTTDTAPPFAPLQVGKPWTELRGCRGLPSKRPRPRGRHPWRPRAQTVCVCCCRSAQPESPIHRVAAPFLNHQPIFRPPIANRCLRLLLHHCGKGTVELPGHGLENTLRPDRLAFRLHLGAASTASKKKIIVAFVPPDGKLRRGTRLFCLRAEGFVRDYSAHWILEPYLSTEYYCQKKSLVSAQYRATGKPVVSCKLHRSWLQPPAAFVRFLLQHRFIAPPHGIASAGAARNGSQSKGSLVRRACKRI